jgi:hypothetical protein
MTQVTPGEPSPSTEEPRRGGLRNLRTGCCLVQVLPPPTRSREWQHQPLQELDPPGPATQNQCYGDMCQAMFYTESFRSNALSKTPSRLSSPGR